MLPAGDTTIVQVKFVLAVVLDSKILVSPIEQMVCEAGVAVTFGAGMTVITTFTGSPRQLFAVGVII
jgi:hypothetical protein